MSEQSSRLHLPADSQPLRWHFQQLLRAAAPQRWAPLAARAPAPAAAAATGAVLATAVEARLLQRASEAAPRLEPSQAVLVLLRHWQVLPLLQVQQLQ